jgi:hypothetical protein
MIPRDRVGRLFDVWSRTPAKIKNRGGNTCEVCHKRLMNSRNNEVKTKENLIASHGHRSTARREYTQRSEADRRCFSQAAAHDVRCRAEEDRCRSKSPVGGMEGKPEKGGLATRSELANEWNHPACGSIFHFGAQVLSRLLYRDSCSWLALRSIYHRFQGNDCPVYLTALSFQLCEDSTNVNFCHSASRCFLRGKTTMDMA